MQLSNLTPQIVKLEREIVIINRKENNNKVNFFEYRDKI